MHCALAHAISKAIGYTHFSYHRTYVYNSTASRFLHDWNTHMQTIVHAFNIYVKYFFKIFLACINGIANMRDACTVNHNMDTTNGFIGFFHGCLIGHINGYCFCLSFIYFNLLNCCFGLLFI